MTNESPTGSLHLGGIQARVTSTNILTNTTTEPTHKI